MNNHGGKRKGAGRPAAPDALKRNTMPVRLPQWLIDEVDNRPGSRGEQVEAALLAFYQIYPPN